MKPRDPVQLPDDVYGRFRHAVRLQWLSFSLMVLCVFLVYFTLGQSQAMRAVFVEDILALVPAIAFLVSARYRWKRPNQRFPYGYHHSVSIGFLCASVALLGLGSMVLFEAVKTLLSREHPTIGVIAIFGHQLWLGWLMYPVLLFCMACEYTMGRLKTPLARELHDKALAADARMNRADWLTGAAACIGITGVAFGWWWADATTAAVIAFEILRDGWSNIHASVSDLMDEVPTKADEDEAAGWSEKLQKRLREIEWIREVDIRLREEGNVFSGEVFVVPRSEDGLPKRAAELQKIARELDWRFYDLSLVFVERL